MRYNLLQGTTKLAVKRTTSEPNQLAGYQSAATATNNQQSQTSRNQSPASVAESFTMTGYSEDAGYFSPSLQEEVFQQVTSIPDSVLLHASHLDSLQVRKYNFN